MTTDLIKISCISCEFFTRDETCLRLRTEEWDILYEVVAGGHVLDAIRERKPASLLDRLFGRTRCGPLGLYFTPRRKQLRRD